MKNKTEVCVDAHSRPKSNRGFLAIALNRAATHWLEIAICFIVIASLYDAWLVYYFRSVIDEENAFCRWLISLEPNHVSVFLLGKLMGTLGVASVLYFLGKYWRAVARPTVMTVLAFQVGLMFYLHAYDSVALKQEQLAASGQQELEYRIARQQNLIADPTPVLLVQETHDFSNDGDKDYQSKQTKSRPRVRSSLPIGRRVALFDRHRVNPRFRPGVKKPVRRPRKNDGMLKDVT